MEHLNHNKPEVIVDPHEAVQHIKHSGSLRLPGFLAPELCNELVQHADELNTSYLDQRAARVGQEFETANFHYPTATGAAINRLGHEVERYIAPALPQWQPNDVAVQRYRSNHLGIEWHRDYARDILLVAVATVEGSARFEIEVYDQPGYSHREIWQIEPGDLVLLRGMGLNDVDDRPYHRIFSPEQGVRTSIAFRHNLRLEA